MQIERRGFVAAAVALCTTLLVREIAIRGQKDIELANSGRQQVAVLLASPAHFGRRFRSVADELVLKPTWQALVKQDAHGRGAPPWPAPMPRPPAPV